jgi:hypothetical protein
MFENCFFIAMPKYDSFGHPQAPKPGLAQNSVPQLDIFKAGAEYCTTHIGSTFIGGINLLNLTQRHVQTMHVRPSIECTKKLSSRALYTA